MKPVLIKNFQDFTKIYGVLESDGFGTLPFLKKKDGNVFYYFFKLDSEKKAQRGFMVTIGKYSQYEDPSGPKNSYAVLNANEIGVELVDDIAVDRKDIPNLDEGVFKLNEGELSRFLEKCSKAAGDYLEQNPQVVRFYDEMQTNLDVENYMEYLKSIVIGSLGEGWTAQEGSSKKVVIIGR